MTVKNTKQGVHEQIHIQILFVIFGLCVCFTLGFCIIIVEKMKYENHKDTLNFYALLCLMSSHISITLTHFRISVPLFMCYDVNVFLKFLFFKLFSEVDQLIQHMFNGFIECSSNKRKVATLMIKRRLYSQVVKMMYFNPVHSLGFSNHLCRGVVV